MNFVKAANFSKHDFTGIILYFYIGFVILFQAPGKMHGALILNRRI